MRYNKVALATLLACGLATTAQAKPLDGQSTDVMIQGFHWLSSDLNSPNWWNTIASKAQELSDAGINMVWFAPPQDTPTFAPQGYIPTHLNILDSFYGTEAELVSAINAVHNSGMKAIADVVINHRGGSTGWCDFKNPDWDVSSIVSNDEAATDPNADATCNGTLGHLDSGQSYGSARDIDHEQDFVQESLKTWMSSRLQGVGFDGWRYDYVKGYGGWANAIYNQATDPYFSVGEYWTTLCYDDDGQGCFDIGGKLPNDHRQDLMNWVTATSNTSAVFDFTTKGVLNRVLGWYKEGETKQADYQFWRLTDGNGKPAGLIGLAPKYAVTFIDNHDTGPSEGCRDGQYHWALTCENIMMGYAYILTHPGIPTVYWSHFYSMGHGNAITDIIAARKEQGVHSESPVQIERAEQGLYAAITTGTNGRVAVKLGNQNWSPAGTDWSVVASGTDWVVWKEGEVIIDDCAKPAMKIRGTVTDVAQWTEWVDMTCDTSTSTWSATATFDGTGDAGGDDRFKFDVLGDWTENYGDNAPADGVADLVGDDIMVAEAGTYLVTLNDRTWQYNLTPVNVSDDNDNDGMPNDWETANGLNPDDASDATTDLDSDGINNLQEFNLGLEANNSDTDNDGMLDGYEVDNGLNPKVDDAGNDPDNDGLTNGEEAPIGTNPNDNDSDNDGMFDGFEVDNGLNPLVADGASDADNDGLSNLEEQTAGTDPNNSDSDADGMPDGFEADNGLNPVVNDAGADKDSDGLTNGQEFSMNTDVSNPDTDGDGLQDGVDPNPLVPQSSGATRFDQNGDGKADLYWRHSALGDNWIYMMNGVRYSSAEYVNNVPEVWTLAGRGDFNGDGKYDVLWRNADNGDNYIHFMNGDVITSVRKVNRAGLEWSVSGVGDFNADGKSDILWRNANTGTMYVYLMNGASVDTIRRVSSITLDWQVAGLGDINGDNKTDVIWRNTSTGVVWVYLMDGAAIDASYQLSVVADPWQFAAAGDFDGDGDADLFWRNSQTGENWVYWMQDGQVDRGAAFNRIADPAWFIAFAGDLNGDGTEDIMWRHAQHGTNWVYLLSQSGSLLDSRELNFVTTDWMVR